MSASKEMVREQLDPIIARVEQRVEQHRAHGGALTPNGNGAKRAQSGFALALSDLKKLQILRSEFDEPQPKLTCRPQVSDRAG
jgi:hypothetical protein